MMNRRRTKLIRKFHRGEKTPEKREDKKRRSMRKSLGQQERALRTREKHHQEADPVTGAERALDL